MNIFKTKRFSEWARKNKLDDRALCNTVKEIAEGLTGASLGGHLFKKRVAVAGRGKRGGLRVIIAYSATGGAFYLYGYAKKKQADIEHEELGILRVMAADLAEHDDEKLQQLVNDGELIEVVDDE